MTFVMLSLACGVIYLYNAVPVYASGSRILVQQSTPRIRSQELVGSDTGTSFLANQMELIRSPAILSAAAASPKLKESKLLAGAGNPVGVLLPMITVAVGKQSDVLTVSAESTDPQEAANVVNAVVDSFKAYQDDQQHSTAAEVLKVLEREKTRCDADLDRITKEMMDFKIQSKVLTFDNDKGNIVTQRLAELSEAVNSADADLLNAKLLQESIASVGDDPRKVKQLMQMELAKGVQINVGQDNSDDAITLKKLRSQLALMLATKYGANDQQIKDLKAEIDLTVADMADAEKAGAADSVAVVQQLYEKAQKKSEALHKAFDDQKVVAFELSGKAAQYAKLVSDETRAEKESDLLDAQIKDINLSDDSGSFSTNILDTASAAYSPVRPLASKVLGEALVAGLMLGLGAAMLRDRMDQRLRSVEEIGALLDLEVLGLIPSMPAKQSRSQRGQLVHTTPRSPVAEAYRTVRTGLYFGTSSSRLKTLLVTSPSPGDGKSTVAANLAIAMAQAGERILLIDCDCRRPSQHKIFELGNEKGLTTIMMGEGTAEDAIQDVGIPNLNVLPCGPVPTNPAEALNSHEFHELIMSLSEEYDRVILDSPPVMPVTDARILAASCDAAVIVVRAEQSNRKLAMHTVEALRIVGGVILGVVVNDVSLRRGRYGYYAGYGYRYHAAYYGPETPNAVIGLPEGNGARKSDRAGEAKITQAR